jgi:hypothetical protein
MLTDEQVTTIRSQIIEQIESTFPEDKKSSSIDQINAMDADQLEEFLEANNMIKDNDDQKCVFCSIVSGDIKSFKLEEDENAVAVLEINPISKGHVIIIPKEHSETAGNAAKNLSEKISKLVKSKLQPKEVKLFSSSLFGHEILNVLPVYENETKDSKRIKTSSEELEKVLVELKAPVQNSKELKKPNQEEEEPKKEEPKSIIEKVVEKLWLPRRIP